MNRILNYLGIARRAGFLVSGTDAVIASLEKKAKLVVIATDASSATKDKLNRKCYFYKVNILEYFTTEELSTMLSVSKSTILRDIKFLKAQIALTWVGPKVGGHWEIKE